MIAERRGAYKYVVSKRHGKVSSAVEKLSQEHRIVFAHYLMVWLNR